MCLCVCVKFAQYDLQFLFSFMTECNNYFKKSLFIVGEIGGNDINAPISYNNISKLREIVPPMIEEITKATIVCHISFKY